MFFKKTPVVQTSSRRSQGGGNLGEGYSQKGMQNLLRGEIFALRCLREIPFALKKGERTSEEETPKSVGSEPITGGNLPPQYRKKEL